MEIINSNKTKLKSNKIYTIVGFAILVLISLVAGFSFALLSDSEEISGITFRFGQIKVVYLDSNGNIVDRDDLTINTKMNQTAKTYKVGDVVNLSGYLGLDDDSFSSFLRLQVFADFKNADGTNYSPESVYTTFKFQEGFNNALASASQTLMERGNNDKAWYNVENNNYIYLGNVATSRQKSAENGTQYDNSNLYNYSGTSITITNNMISDEINGKIVDLTFVCQALVQKLNPLENMDNGYTQINANNIANLNWASYFADDYGLVQSTQVLTSATDTATKTATLTRKFDNITGYVDTPEYVVKPNTDGTATIGSITYTDLNPNAVYVATRQRLTPAFTTGESSVYKVTAFASNAFDGCKLITGLYLPKGLTSITNSSFNYCKALNRVDCYSFDTWMNINFSSYPPLTVAKNLYFDDGSDAYNQTELDLSNYSKINSHAFYNWSNLKSVILSNKLESIGSDAFFGCRNLTRFYIESVASWLKVKFGSVYDSLYGVSNVKLFVGNEEKEEITAEDLNGVTNIPRYAFSDYGGIKSITIPEGVESIGNNAFEDCTSLTSITIPSSVKSIGEYAFSRCRSLTSITIPDKVTSIPRNAFNECSNLISVTIPDKVTSIGSSAFYYCSSLTSITIPDTVESIGYDAFYCCSDLTSITIPNSVTSIGSSAFYYCSSLTSITIPEGVTSIGYSAFRGCRSLTSIAIPDKVTSIGSLAFSDCRSLTSITIPNSVTSIGSDAFEDTNIYLVYNFSTLNIEKNSNNGCVGLKAVKIYNLSSTQDSYVELDGVRYLNNDNSLTAIGITGEKNILNLDNRCNQVDEFAFYKCVELTSITMPEGVTSIGDSAFYECSGLTSIELPNSLTSIGTSAFYGCRGLTSIELPNSLTSIGTSAFYGCRGLTSVTISENVTVIGNSAFYGCEKLKVVYNLSRLVIYPRSDFNGYVARYAQQVYKESPTTENVYYKVISGVRYLENSDSSLTAIGMTGEETVLNLDNNCTAIYQYAFYKCRNLTSITIPSSVKSIGDSAFSGCSSLTSVTFGNNSQLTSIGSLTFFDCRSLTSITFGNNSRLTSISSSAFSGCRSLTSITIPSDVTSIGDYAFESCTSLTSITIPSSVTSIGNNAFESCTSLTSITIPSNVTSIGDSAFSGCSGLTSVTFGNNSQLTSIGSSAFYNCSNLTSITIPSSVTSIGDYAFYKCINLTGITIPEGVKSIPRHAFYECSSLTSVMIPNSVTSIGIFAFYKCGNLTSITIPSDVTSIGSDAFESCTSLTSITIPSSVTSIGSSAFRGCSSLTSVTIPSSVTSIGGSAFERCTSLTSITIPSSVTSIGGSAFERCTSLTSITIPSSVTSIEWKAFSECRNLTSITIPSSVTSIGGSAFSECRNLTSITIPSSVTSIGSDAFVNCYNMKDVIISDFGAWSMISFGSATANPISQVFNNNSSSFTTCGAKLYLQKTNGDGTIAKELVTRITEQDLATNTAKKIGNYAFYGYRYLTSVVLPSGFSVGTDAFRYCYALGEVYNFTGTTVTAGSSSSTLGYAAQYAKVVKTEYDRMDGEVGVIESAVVMGSEDSNVLYYVKKDENGIVTKKVLLKVLNNGNSGVVIDVDCTEISGYAFYDCDKLVDVYFSGTEDVFNRITTDTSNNCNKPMQLAKKHYLFGWIVNEEKSKASTCTEEGYIVYEKEGSEDIRIATSKLPHDYGEDGLCKNCGAEIPLITITENGSSYTFVDLNENSTLVNRYNITMGTYKDIGDFKFTSNNQGKHGTTATITIKANKDCNLYWAVSSEPYMDYLTIVSGAKGKVVSGTNTAKGVLSISAGDTITIEYRRISSSTFGQDSACFAVASAA